MPQNWILSPHSLIFVVKNVSNIKVLINVPINFSEDNWSNTQEKPAICSKIKMAVTAILNFVHFWAFVVMILFKIECVTFPSILANIGQIGS